MLAVTTFETFVIGLAGASFPVLTGAWFVRRKTKAETADLITQSADRVVQMMDARIAELQVEVAALRAKLVLEQAERAALNLRLANTEERERAAVLRIAELQAEIDVLRERIARYENPKETS